MNAGEWHKEDFEYTDVMVKVHCNLCDEEICSCDICRSYFEETDDIYCKKNDIYHICENCFGNLKSEDDEIEGD